MMGGQEKNTPMVGIRRAGARPTRHDGGGCMRYRAREVDERLDFMIQVAVEMDISLDVVVKALGRCSQSDFLRISGNPSDLPKYIKSSVSP